MADGITNKISDINDNTTDLITPSRVDELINNDVPPKPSTKELDDDSAERTKESTDSKNINEERTVNEEEADLSSVVGNNNLKPYSTSQCTDRSDCHTESEEAKLTNKEKQDDESLVLHEKDRASHDSSGTIPKPTAAAQGSDLSDTVSTLQSKDESEAIVVKDNHFNKESTMTKTEATETHPLMKSELEEEEELYNETPSYSYTYKKKESLKAGQSQSSPPAKKSPASEKVDSTKRWENHVEALDPGKLYKGDLTKDMSDMGCYSLFTMTAVSLYALFEDSPYDKKFVEETIKIVGARLKQQKAVIEAGQVIGRGDGMDETKPFVVSLREEEFVKQFKEEALVFDLVDYIIRSGTYDARARSLLKYVSSMLGVRWERVEMYETYLVETFMEEEHTMTEEEKKEKIDKEKSQKYKKYALIGLATIGGGTLLGLTGGLAAPFIAAGAGAVIGGAGAAALGSVAGVYIIGSLFGAAGAGLMGYKMNKRVGDLEEFEFEELTSGRQLHVTVAICGWLTEENPDFHTAWQGLDNSGEQYVLRYESKYLKQVGSAMDYIMDVAMKSAATEALKYTVLSGLMAAVAWPAFLVSASSIIDNPWSVVMNRSALAGKQLANVLLSRHQGKRPITLIGFSLGARVVYYCLQELANSKNCEGIVEEAIMLGTPVTRSSTEWKKIRRVVSGRIINGFCRTDWLLRFLYRTASVQYNIAGLGPIEWRDRRMHNVDLTDVVTGHMDYLQKIDDILDIVGVRTKEHRPTSSSSLSSLVDHQKNASIKKSASKSNVKLTDKSAKKDEASGSAGGLSRGRYGDVVMGKAEGGAETATHGIDAVKNM